MTPEPTTAGRGPSRRRRGRAPEHADRAYFRQEVGHWDALGTWLALTPVCLAIYWWLVTPLIRTHLAPWGTLATETAVWLGGAACVIVVLIEVRSAEHRPRAHWLEGDTLVQQIGTTTVRLRIQDIEGYATGGSTRPGSIEDLTVRLHDRDGNSIEIPLRPDTYPLRAHLYRHLRTQRPLTVRSGELARFLYVDADDPDNRRAP